MPPPTTATGTRFLCDDGTWATGGGGGGGSSILDGACPPDPATGTVDSYYTDTLTGILYGPKSASGWGPSRSQRSAVQARTPRTTMSRGRATDSSGPGRITKIRYRRVSTADAIAQLRIWSDAGAKVAETTDNQGGVNGTFDVTLATPLAVAANESLTLTTGSSNGSLRSAAVRVSPTRPMSRSSSTARRRRSTTSRRSSTRPASPPM